MYENAGVNKDDTVAILGCWTDWTDRPVKFAWMKGAKKVGLLPTIYLIDSIKAKRMNKGRGV